MFLTGIRSIVSYVSRMGAQKRKVLAVVAWIAPAGLFAIEGSAMTHPAPQDMMVITAVFLWGILNTALPADPAMKVKAPATRFVNARMD